MSYKVFISHGSGKDDTVMATILEEKLSERGVDSFLDHIDVGMGIDFRSRIRTELQGCDELFCILSPDSISRPWVAAEVGAAFALQKTIVPITVYIGDEDLQKSGFTSLLGTVAPVSFADLMLDFDSYFEATKNRMEEKGNA